MAIAAPHVKLLRQLAKAKDDYLSGAFDIEWDGGFATIFMVFGQPSHAIYESSGTRLTGEAALNALLQGLPSQFTVGDWRRVMSPQETLNVSVEDITEPIAELVGEHSEVTDRDGDATSWLYGLDDSPDLGFDVDSFPLLPRGAVLWSETPAQDAALQERIASLDAALVVLTGMRLRAAGVVRDGDLIDAVWVDSADHARGETAAMALLGAQEGTIAGYALDGTEVAEAISMLWRLPRGEPIATAWVDAPALLTSLEQDREDHALLIEGPLRAVGLFSGGKALAVYTSTSPEPVTSTDQLLDAMRRPGTTLRVLQRRSRPQHGTPVQTTIADPVSDLVDALSAEPERYEPFAAFALDDAPAAPVSDAEAPHYGAYEHEPQIANSSAYPDDPDFSTASAVDTSSWVDYDEVRAELVAIAVAWLGADAAAPVTACVLSTRSAVEDFITTIETIRRMAIPGHDSTAMYSMTREMQMHAAERLCGA